uniref:RNA-directed RNA polymerase L n=1 Tax=Neotermes castaneus bunya-like virus 1 TaxID=3133466 RepID=A0AAT9JN40_9VIRU
MADYMLKLAELKNKLEVNHDALCSLFDKDQISGELLANYQELLEKIRHDCVVTAVASRYDVDTEEKTFHHHLNGLVGEKVMSAALTNRDFDKTPDLFYKSEERDPRTNRLTIRLCFIEIAVTRSYAATVNRKVSKYAGIIEDFGSYVKKGNPGCFLISKFITIVISAIENNWASEFQRLGHSCRSNEVEEAAHNLFLIANNYCSLVPDRQYLLSTYEQRAYRAARAHETNEENPIDVAKLNFKEIDHIISKLDNIMEDHHFPVQADSKHCFEKLHEYLANNWKTINTKFQEPNDQNIRKAQVETTKEINSSFEELDFNQRSPTCHFAYTEKNVNDQHSSYASRFVEAAEHILKIESEEPSAHFVKDIFNLKRLNEVDKEVFFSEKPLENWNDVKKMLDNVKEPKVLKDKNLHSKSKFILAEAGVKQKKAFKTLRGHESVRIMRNLKWWEAENWDKIALEVERKSDWLILQRSQIKQSDFKSEDDALTKICQKWRNTHLFELENHIHIIAQNVLYRGPRVGRGIQVLNTGNKDVWFIILPGGDVTKDRGDVRFIQVLIVNTKQYKEQGLNIVFNYDLVKDYYEVGEKTILVTRWLSLNRERWVHIERTIILPFVIMMDHRMNIPMTSFKELVFAYFYSAYGCQSKISAILDNFRYMIPGAMSMYSGIAEYIKDKMVIAVKTSGQAWLLKKLFKVVRKYASESKELKTEDLLFVDEELDDDTGGLHGSLSSPFVKKFKWFHKDHAMGEIYIAFHLTGKSFHDPIFRDVNFVKDVMGGEVEFKDKFGNYEQSKVENGFPLEEVDIVMQQGRGGLYCRDLVLLSGHEATVPVSSNRDAFLLNLQQERLTEGVLSEKLLTSTKSAIESHGFNSKGKYELKTSTLLEMTLRQVEENCKDVINAIKSELKKHEEVVINLMSENLKHLNVVAPEPEVSGGSSGDLASSEGSNDSLRLKLRDLKKQQDMRMKDIFPELEKNEQNVKEKILAISNRSERLKELGDHLDRMKLQNLETDIFQNISSTVTLAIRGKNYTIGSEMYDNILSKYDTLVDRAGMKTLYELADEIDTMNLAKNHPLSNGVLRRDSPLGLALSNLETIPIYRIVPKGQRTQKDREIFVQNSSRYVTFVEEHIFRAICRMLPNECITESGDDKMTKLKKLYERGQVWKAKASKDTNCKMTRHVRYITGDMSKFSNHDTAWRLRTFIEGGEENLPKSVYKILLSLIKLATRKRVVAPNSLITKFNDGEFDPDDPLFELFSKCDSEFPECAMKQNWLQGMRNFIASSASVGACMTMAKFFHKIAPGELYFDFLVHSDDWAICYGFSHPEVSQVMKYDFAWRRKLNINSDKDVDRFMLTTIFTIFKLNNLTVSVKKSSVSDKFVEFVSYVVNGGSCYMGYEKQLISIFSEKPCKGTQEDCSSLLSQSSGAIQKGCDSTVADMFIHFAMERLRNDYSMGEGQKLDPCSKLKIKRDMLPLCMFPNLKVSSLDMTLTSVNSHDFRLVNNLYKEIVVNGSTDEEVINAGKLVTCMSVIELGKKPGFSCKTEVDTDDNFIPGLCFRPQSVEKLVEKMEARKTFDLFILKHIMNYDFTSSINKPTDFMFSLLHNHMKLFDPEVLHSIAGKNKINFLRLRGTFKTRKSVKFNSDDFYDTFENCFLKLKAWMDLTTLESLKRDITILKLLTENLNTTDKRVANWLSETNYKMSAQNKKSIRSLVKMPILTKMTTFINPVRVLLTHELNPLRFHLNKMIFKNQACLESDKATLRNFLKISGYHQCKSHPERKHNLERIAKFFPPMTSKLILTVPKKYNISLEICLRWVKQNNTFLYKKAFTNETGKLEDLMSYVTEKKRSKLECQNEISELAMITRLAIDEVTQDLIVTSKANESIRDIVLRLKLQCIDRNVELSEKYRLMFAFLEKYYLNSEEQCRKNFSKEVSFVRLKNDRKWNRKTPYRNAQMLLTKAHAGALFTFNEGLLTVDFSHHYQSRYIKEFLEFFYRVHKRSVSFDTYQYFQEDEDLRFASRRHYYIVGYAGNYEIVDLKDERFQPKSCRGILRDNMKLDLPDKSGKVVITENMECKLEGAIVGQLRFYQGFQYSDTYRIKGWQSLFDINKVIEEGLLVHFVYNFRESLNINLLDFVNKERIFPRELIYLKYFMYEYERIMFPEPASENYQEWKAVQSMRDDRRFTLVKSLQEDEEEEYEGIGRVVFESSESEDETSLSTETSTGDSAPTGSSGSDWEKEVLKMMKRKTKKETKERTEKITLKYTPQEEKQFKENKLSDLDDWCAKVGFRVNLTGVTYLMIMIMMWYIFGDDQEDLKIDVTPGDEKKIKHTNFITAFFKYQALQRDIEWSKDLTKRRLKAEIQKYKLREKVLDYDCSRIVKLTALEMKKSMRQDSSDEDQ